ncbi:MarR family transcriptional regulator [Alicyclobacillus macrosporangiidus]|uniref:MarR family transcriptional regulator n=1 Tax=Alicyclobacillus macrosporangiidus TaxID=392015 RepID=UPI0018CC5DDF|nr:MarR family transcriptional regulator [Alicyclobacillus macrosporangiidus]
MIRIAVVGSKKMVEQVSFLNTNTRVQIDSYVYETPEQSAELVHEALSSHAILFTGPVPYYFARPILENAATPAEYVAFDEFAFLLTIQHMREVLGVHTQRLSIDIPRKQVVYNVFDEIGVESTGVFVKEHETAKVSEQHRFDDEWVAFHETLWRSNKTEFALTSVQSVYEKLYRLGVPCLRLIIPKKNIVDALQRAIAKAELVISQFSQIAVGIITVHAANESGGDADRKLHENVHERLLAFCRRMNASVTQTKPGNFVVYGTKGGIQQITRHYTTVPLLNDLWEWTDVVVRVGFGFGITAKEAEEHARIALYHSEQENRHSAYIVTEDKKVIGPIGQNATRTFQLQSQNEQILSIARHANISVSSVTKIMDFIALRNNHVFTASDLAQYLQLSKRSAERVLKKLVERGYAEVCGEEQPYQRGRPRSVYRLLVNPWIVRS